MNKTKSKQQLKLKPKQNEILIYLYKFRFLNRIQLQTLLKHKYHSRILLWLNELNKSGCIRAYFDKSFASSSTVYSLGTVGRKYLKNNPGFKEINPSLLDRIWGEDELSLEFQKHCQLVADIYLSLRSLTNKTNAKLSFSTTTELHGTQYLILPNPDAYFAIEESSGTIKRYFLDIFDDIAPTRMRKRVRQYFNYYKNGYWQDHTDKPFPEIILVAPGDRLKHHLGYFIQGKLKQDAQLSFYLSTRDQVQKKGLTKETLQKVTI